MCDFNQPHQPAIQPRSLARILRNIPLALPATDYQELQAHLEDCECALRPGSKLLAYVLANKLMNRRPEDAVHHSDLVVGGSCVTYVVDGERPRQAFSFIAPEQDCPAVSSQLHRCLGLR
ncbi:hypothetical protein STA1M1_37370 [Sinisalibacter aestuarii]|uniref:Uncharacterized protein n=1 Tax=Sinisalibacter aestuarii TaxID=2949426 RepID=A0ABQ5LZ08_9RHOB|nr:hypothetical protein STA1M1_37370 [Sinisalibacter aestuarii]